VAAGIFRQRLTEVLKTMSDTARPTEPKNQTETRQR